MSSDMRKLRSPLPFHWDIRPSSLPVLQLTEKLAQTAQKSHINFYQFYHYDNILSTSLPKLTVISPLNSRRSTTETGLVQFSTPDPYFLLYAVYFRPFS